MGYGWRHGHTCEILLQLERFSFWYMMNYMDELTTFIMPVSNNQDTLPTLLIGKEIGGINTQPRIVFRTIANGFKLVVWILA